VIRTFQNIKYVYHTRTFLSTVKAIMLLTDFRVFVVFALYSFSLEFDFQGKSNSYFFEITSDNRTNVANKSEILWPIHSIYNT